MQLIWCYIQLVDMKYILIYSLFFSTLFISELVAQENCKVLVEEISDNYEGECKKGLAHGYGIAKSKDVYEGEFKRGYPDGSGVYTYSTGRVYDGEWNKGLKEGQGKLVISTFRGDSIVTGFWREDRYLGEKYIPPYEILQESNVERNSIKKMPTNGNHRVVLMIRDYSGNASGISNFIFNTTSGVASGASDRTIIDNIDFPFEGNISYIATSKISGQPINVLFNFVLNDPSSWQIVLKNQ